MKDSLSVMTRAVAAVVVFFLSASALALETSTAVRGVVTDQAGNPLANATVTVRNEQTSLTRVVQTDADGEFSVRNLQVAEEPALTRLTFDASDAELNAALDALRGAQHTIVEARRDRRSLEDIFIERVGGMA